MRAGADDEVPRQVFQLFPREPAMETESRCQKRQRDLDFSFGGQFDFGQFSRLANAREHPQLFRVPGSRLRVGQVRPSAGPNFFEQEIDDAFVQVVSPQAGVAVGREHLEHAVVQLEDGEVKGAAAQVINRDFRALVQLVQTIGQRRRGRLVHDPLDTQAGHFARSFRGVALRIVEVGWHRDDRAGHGFAKKRRRIAHQLLQHLRRDFLRGVVASVDLEGDRSGVLASDRIGHLHFLL